MTSPIAYLNGKYLPIEQASLHIFDMGIVGGVAITEMVRTFRHQLFQLDQHLSRFANSTQKIGVEIGLTSSELTQICGHVVEQNAKLISEQHDLGLIVFSTAGENPTYVGRTKAVEQRAWVGIHTFPLPFELWADLYQQGLHLVTVSTRSIPDDVIDPRIKHRSRLHWHLAAHQAKQIDPGAMAILTDHEGLLTETATGNLCVVDGNTIITPAAHVLEGVSRNYVAELAATAGLEFIHASISPEELGRADEAFLTSTPHCLLPVTRFNKASIGSGRPGPIYEKLLAMWGDAVQVNIREQMKRGAMDRSNS